MKRSFAHFGIIMSAVVVFSAVCCQAPAEEAPQYIETSGFAFAAQSVVNMMEEPAYTAEMGTQALMGTPLKLVARDTTYWVKVETPDGYQAWVNELGIAIATDEEMARWKESDRLIVTAYHTFFFEKASAESRHVADAVAGNIVLRGEEESEDGFIKVTLPGGKQAYVPSEDVTDFKEWAASRSDEGIISTAMDYAGIPYVWGGTSIKGVDCSGLTQNVFFLNGYLLPRNASQQAKVGEEIDISQGLDNLVPGDLIFFGEKRISHVAIYLGENRIIQSSQVVRINSLNDSDPDYYERKPVCARRIAGNQDNGMGIGSLINSDIYFE